MSALKPTRPDIKRQRRNTNPGVAPPYNPPRIKKAEGSYSLTKDDIIQDEEVVQCQR